MNKKAKIFIVVLACSCLISLFINLTQFNKIRVLKDEVSNLKEQANCPASGDILDNKEAEVVGLHAPTGFAGIKRYIGENPIRFEPKEDPLYFFHEDMVFEEPLVEVLKIVRRFDDPFTHWALVCTDRGWLGYVNPDELVDPRPYRHDEYINFYKEDLELESIGGFYLGERIEKIIGESNESYDLVYELPVRVYLFENIEAFVLPSNQVYLLRTDSPEIKLKSGHTVSDLAVEVFKYYEAKYDYYENVYPWPEEEGIQSMYSFLVAENIVLDFIIDTDILNEDSIITSIRLRGLQLE